MDNFYEVLIMIKHLQNFGIHEVENILTSNLTW